MIVERVELQIKDGMAEAFAAAMHERGLALLSPAEGCHWVKLGRGVENPNTFILLLEWDTVDQHMSFLKHPDHAAFRALSMPFSEGGAMEHFDMIG